MEQSGAGGGDLFFDLVPDTDFHPRLRSADALAAALKRRHPERIVAELVVPERQARHAEFPPGLDPCLVGALRERGIERLYSHQRECWDHVANGNHVVVVTPTASGKTLCYNLPVLQAALSGRAKALYLFPTKALSQDQVAEILELNAAGNLGIRAMTFDGDTPGDARRAVRTHGDIVVSNPDMLHQAILPHHTKWAQFFENLRFVVVDELHTYRGVFGSHMANVIRRLRRIARFYGAEPQFVLCSATIANPAELAQRLLGSPVSAVTESGAPHGRKQLLVWNPPVVNADLGLRASARSQSTRIAKAAVGMGLKTIVFANSRLEVEVLTKYLKDTFDNDPRTPPRVASYRGGYLPTDRRDKEKRLRAGRIDCVVATSALELGVDIGALDVCVLNGYPGTIAGALQRIGRAGRRNRPALGVLVCSSNLLDQYLARNPEFFLEASPEHARIDPDQLLILMDHVRCAAFELPFDDGETFGGLAVSEALDYLKEQGVLHREANRWHWIADSYPANAVSLRSIAEGNFLVVDITDGAKRIIAEVDYSAAAVTLYEGAIHLIQASPWQVEKLDWVGRKAYARKVAVDYYTDAIDYTKLKVLDEFERQDHADGSCRHGEVHVVRRVAGYKKIRYYTHENIGYGNVNLPDHEMHTTAVWWQLEPDILAAEFASRFEALDGFLGAAYALHHMAAMLSLAELRDIGRSVGDGQAGWSATLDAQGRPSAQSLDGQPVDIGAAHLPFHPAVHLYDNYPGGIGLSAPLFDLRSAVVQRATELVRDCPCTHGCPACIGPVLPPDARARHSPKSSALRILALMQGDTAAGLPQMTQ
ncbi:MAG: DEAD/DEAH box helicase [Betaproteobacteria bacterium]|nr:DEAD/DEAH box helicase [Betaproteobacteria bacterium]